ncbi:alpha-galactosidase [Acrasis kona]|uniref:Alpha-galactosidase n=1 Tax=Acrasis kona TaxID=1008807 RepID=A0AAW2Z0A7_9EUKA
MNSFLSLLLFSSLFILTLSHNNGVARTPPMGWNSWNQFACNIDQDLLTDTIDQIVSSGLADAGYKFVNIDDCWSYKNGRDNKTNELIPDPVRFSRGIHSLSKYAHSKGVKLGIYGDVGFTTCAGYPGTLDHFQTDADTFARWEIDYLKLDFCDIPKKVQDEPWIYFGYMSEALNKTGRPIVFSICAWQPKEMYKWARKIGNSWRTTDDINVSWQSVLSIIDQNRELYPYAEPGSWNDPDMLEVGVVRDGRSLSQNQARTHFSLWTLLSAPLLLGNDLRKIRDPDQKWVFDILTNRDAIAVNQDPNGAQGRSLYQNIQGKIDRDGNCESKNCTRTEVWGRPLTRPTKQSYAAILFNRAGPNVDDEKFTQEKITIRWSSLGMPSDAKVRVKDIWSNKDLGVYQGSFTSEPVEKHNVVYIRLEQQ